MKHFQISWKFPKNCECLLINSLSYRDKIYQPQTSRNVVVHMQARIQEFLTGWVPNKLTFLHTLKIKLKLIACGADRRRSRKKLKIRLFWCILEAIFFFYFSLTGRVRTRNTPQIRYICAGLNWNCLINFHEILNFLCYRILEFGLAN